MEHENETGNINKINRIPQWVLDVVFWTQNNFLAKIFEEAGKNSEKALEMLKGYHREKALKILSELDKKKNE